MRPVNLIPQDQRRGERGTSRTGQAPYALLGVLGLVLAGVVALVLTGAQIDERKAEVATLEQREQVATARAEALRPYVDFATLAATREQTVDQLANSRFDWERVLSELALVLPSDVWLTSLTGTVSPAVEVQGATGVEARAEIPGPALELVGCAASQEGVANLISTLRDIDGVTRVGLDSSARPDAGSGGSTGEAAAGGSGDDDCRTRDFITQFHIVLAFDAATAAVGSTESEAPPAPPADPGTTETDSGTQDAPAAEADAGTSGSAAAATTPASGGEG